MTTTETSGVRDLKIDIRSNDASVVETVQPRLLAGADARASLGSYIPLRIHLASRLMLGNFYSPERHIELVILLTKQRQIRTQFIRMRREEMTESTGVRKPDIICILDIHQWSFSPP